MNNLKIAGLMLILLFLAVRSVMAADKIEFEGHRVEGINQSLNKSGNGKSDSDSGRGRIFVIPKDFQKKTKRNLSEIGVTAQ